MKFKRQAQGQEYYENVQVSHDVIEDTGPVDTLSESLMVGVKHGSHPGELPRAQGAKMIISRIRQCRRRPVRRQVPWYHPGYSDTDMDRAVQQSGSSNPPGQST